MTPRSRIGAAGLRSFAGLGPPNRDTGFDNTAMQAAQLPCPCPEPGPGRIHNPQFAIVERRALLRLGHFQLAS